MYQKYCIGGHEVWHAGRKEGGLLEMAYPKFGFSAPFNFAPMRRARSCN